MNNLKVKIDLNKPTRNFWVDNGLVVLRDEIGTGEFEVSAVKDKLIEKLTPETGNEGEYYDGKLQRVVKYRKRNWIYPSNNFIKATPKAPKIKIDGKEYFTHPPKYNLRLNFSSKLGTCDICGEENHLTDAKMWMFPFAVEPNKFSNFYSGFKQGIKVCPRCALAGLAGYLGWLWRVQGKKLHIFIFHSDLEYMYKLRKDVFKPLEFEEGSKAGNIPVEFAGSYIHETTLGLILRLFREMKAKSGQPSLSKEGIDLLEKIIGGKLQTTSLTLFAFSGTMSRAFNMDAMFKFSEFNTLYHLYEDWISLFSHIEGNSHKLVTNIFKQFYQREGKNTNTIWRDKISWAVLGLRDPSSFIEDFLFEVKLRNQNPLAFGTIDVLEIYLKEVMNMDEKFLSILRGFGHNLGKVANEKNEMGLLYALRNAKNLEEFFRILNDIQFRLGLTIPEDLLLIEKGEKIKGSPWIRVKTLLSIYAMNSYLLSNKQKEEES